MNYSCHKHGHTNIHGRKTTTTIYRILYQRKTSKLCEDLPIECIEVQGELLLDVKQNQTSPQRQIKSSYLSAATGILAQTIEELIKNYIHSKRFDEKLQLQQLFNNNTEHQEYINQCIKEAAKEALGYSEHRKPYKPYWWDEDIEQYIEDKRQKCQRCLSSTTNKDRSEQKEKYPRRKMRHWKKLSTLVEKKY